LLFQIRPESQSTSLP